MTRDEQTERGRFDRTRTRRFFEAIQLAEPIIDDILRRLECVLRNEHTDEESLKAAALGAYEKAGEIVTSVGLEIRHRALDGPDAPLEWERRSYIGCDAEASQQVLWDYARRYWLCDKLMLPTEADAYTPDTDGDAPRRRTQR